MVDAPPTPSAFQHFAPCLGPVDSLIVSDFCCLWKMFCKCLRRCFDDKCHKTDDSLQLTCCSVRLQTSGGLTVSDTMPRVVTAWDGFLSFVVGVESRGAGSLWQAEVPAAVCRACLEQGRTRQDVQTTGETAASQWSDGYTAGKDSPPSGRALCIYYPTINLNYARFL